MNKATWSACATGRCFSPACPSRRRVTPAYRRTDQEMLNTFIKCKYHAWMQTLTEELIRAGWAGRVVSQTQMARLLDGTPQRRYNLVNRALRHGELLQLRRGLYLLAPHLHGKPPHPLVLAQALQPGSYVSFETALSFHGGSPESVPVTLSVLPGRRRQGRVGGGWSDPTSA